MQYSLSKKGVRRNCWIFKVTVQLLDLQRNCRNDVLGTVIIFSFHADYSYVVCFFIVFLASHNFSFLTAKHSDLALF